MQRRNFLASLAAGLGLGAVARLNKPALVCDECGYRIIRPGYNKIQHLGFKTHQLTTQHSDSWVTILSGPFEFDPPLTRSS